MFEALHVAGGVLMYGIPEFRLPKAIVQNEVDYVKSLGVEIKLDSVIGKLNTIDELLKRGFDAVFLGTGAGLPMFMNIPGENLNGIYSANEFLTRVNLMKAYRFPEYDTPVKSAKTWRSSAAATWPWIPPAALSDWELKKSISFTAVPKKRCPPVGKKLENAKEEGIIFKLLTNPKRFIGNEQGFGKTHGMLSNGCWANRMPAVAAALSSNPAASLLWTSTS